MKRNDQEDKTVEDVRKSRSEENLLKTGQIEETVPTRSASEGVLSEMTSEEIKEIEFKIKSWLAIRRSGLNIPRRIAEIDQEETRTWLSKLEEEKREQYEREIAKYSF